VKSDIAILDLLLSSPLFVLVVLSPSMNERELDGHAVRISSVLSTNLSQFSLFSSVSSDRYQTRSSAVSIENRNISSLSAVHFIVKGI
jgi:hypothetical protein